MTASFKPPIIFILAIICINFGNVAKADTKVLANIRIDIFRSLREETISLENDKDLQIKGVYEEKYSIPDDSGHVLKATIEYVGDKYGYRAKYTLVKEEFVQILRLNPSTLKSVTG